MLSDRHVQVRRPLCRVMGHRRRRVSESSPAQPLAGEQDDPIDGQEHCRGQRLGEHRSELVLQKEAGQPGRDGAQHDQPGHPFIRGVDSPVTHRREEAPRDADPVSPEQDQKGSGRGHVQPDDEPEIRRFCAGLLGDQSRPAPAQPGRHQNGVFEAGDREQLGHPLEQADDNRLEVRQVLHAGSLGRCPPCWPRSFPHTRRGANRRSAEES
jgi:hypothetical protein